jgi:hypothetical protein
MQLDNLKGSEYRVHFAPADSILQSTTILNFRAAQFRTSVVSMFHDASVQGYFLRRFGKVQLCRRLWKPQWLSLVAIHPKAYAPHMKEKPTPPNRTVEAQMKLVALLVYIAEQKRKSIEAMEQLFRRLMQPGKK